MKEVNDEQVCNSDMGPPAQIASGLVPPLRHVKC